MVMAWVDVKMGTGIIGSTGSGRRFSRAVATQVAGITKRQEHVLCRFDSETDPSRLEDRSALCGWRAD